MNNNERSSRPAAETDSDRLRGLVAINALSVDLVSVFAGDRRPSEDENLLLDELKTKRGKRFYSDLLYSTTHLYIPPEDAEKIWGKILIHKFEISKTLNRNVGIVVATLDYFSNLDTGLPFPTLVGEAHMARIVNLSMRDGLTGLFNHTSCFEILDLELRSHIRHKAILSFIIADLDDFKTINDRFGHQAGDKALIQLASVLKKETRESDICCRYGGEEFAVILPLTDNNDAKAIAERIRTGVLNMKLEGYSTTISLGVASCDANEADSRSLVEKADRALYQAKQKGKNRVETA